MKPLLFLVLVGAVACTPLSFLPAAKRTEEARPAQIACSDSTTLATLESIHRKAADELMQKVFDSSTAQSMTFLRLAVAATKDSAKKAQSQHTLDSTVAVLQHMEDSVKHSLTFHYENVITLARDTIAPSVTCQVDLTMAPPDEPNGDKQIVTYTVRMTDERKLYVTSSPLKM